ncbi:TKL protein kinase [Saprolegnia parasitica CBS 223.65]|uniref:TKL protein kinase n=1 Tax=Saprolegnia parasitica (strain CBS 223.65) TaxID=695850 RepID=A0A067D794_SAPPC|nr:TKL protein kinase [Saprolegnia parasitica CBS 223.65]KDO34877.1 TKL protein kinase [Saprolegnia parasitica CBS 223.65]|eukprot:XP_012194539.1 TKL protein kinase [Saprolegnia parasitica CBS 223.65]
MGSCASSEARMDNVAVPEPYHAPPPMYHSGNGQRHAAERVNRAHSNPSHYNSAQARTPGGGARTPGRGNFPASNGNRFPGNQMIMPRSNKETNHFRDDVNCGEYTELEPYKKQYWLDSTDIVHTRIVPGNYMKTELGHYLGQPVLIKSLIFSSSPEDLAKNKKALVSEVRSMARLQHPNIVKFIGFYITEDHGLCCISEYMEGKTLRHLLENKRVQLSWEKEKISIALDICAALVYMHSLSPRLIHRNIRAEKVLLTNRREAKLSGFGCARDRTYENTMTAGVGEIQWSAPELLQDGEDYDEKVDVYSFGVVLTELDTRKSPYEEELQHTPTADLTMKLVTGMLRPSISDDCPTCIKMIIRQCLQHDPALRPTSDKVLEALREARVTLMQGK